MLARLSARITTALALTPALAVVMAFGLGANSGAQSPPQYGQPAGSALEQSTPAYGQPAGAALDQTNPAYGQPAGSALEQPPAQQPIAAPNSQPVPPQPGSGNPALNGMQPQPTQPGQPMANPVCDNIDLTSAVFSRFEMGLDNAQFLNSAVDKLHVIVTDLDMKNGTLSGLSIAVKGGQFSDVAFDQLNIVTQGPMVFDRNQMVNDRILAFRQPVQAQVIAVVSQDSLNRFLNSPETLQRLSVTAQQKVHFLASMLGSNANIGVSLNNANVSLEKGNRVNVGVNAKFGMGSVGVPLPLAIDTKLGLGNDGWIALSDTHLISNGQEISPLLSNMLMKKFDEMTDWGKKNDDIHFSFSELKVVPSKQFIVKGTAQIARLRFGHN